MFIMWLVKTLIYPPSTIDVMAHQRYAEEVDEEEVDEATAAPGAGGAGTAWDELLMLQ
jgi:hypothetical protein